MPIKILASYDDSEFQQRVKSDLTPGTLISAQLRGHITPFDTAAILGEYTVLDDDSLVIASGQFDTDSTFHAILGCAEFDGNESATVNITTRDETVGVVEVHSWDRTMLARIFSGSTRAVDNAFRTTTEGRRNQYVLVVNSTNHEYTEVIKTPSQQVFADQVNAVKNQISNGNLAAFKSELRYDNFGVTEDSVGYVTDIRPLDGKQTVEKLEYTPHPSELKTETEGVSTGADTPPDGNTERSERSGNPTPTETTTQERSAPTRAPSRPQSRLSELHIDFEYQWSEAFETDLSDYGGREKLCQTIQEKLVYPYRDNPNRVRELGIPIPSLLLYGPPGTGKSYLAEAIAGEIGYPYAILSGGDILSQWINASAKQVKQLFSEAKAIADQTGGVVVFVDEIDSVLSKRGGANQHAEDQKVVNEFLTHLENAGENHILFIGATNAHAQIDAAAISRFDETIEIGLPEKATRKQIVTVQLRSRPNAISDDQLSQVADATQGYSARDLKKIVIDAARHALINSDRNRIEFEDLRRAVIDFDPQ
ncbi:ATP-binding protein [Haloferax mucosum]|uniref:ATP-binding protein n=1 Tax=Haloferax mucosum TaxID=403181 RepID=UPI0013759683|nr:ATP-binding protein [Haloferax mucosum]